MRLTYNYRMMMDERSFPDFPRIKRGRPRSSLKNGLILSGQPPDCAMIRNLLNAVVKRPGKKEKIEGQPMV